MGAYAGPTHGQQSHKKRINETIKHSEYRVEATSSESII